MGLPRKVEKEAVSAAYLSIDGGQHDSFASHHARRLRRGFGDGKSIHFAKVGLMLPTTLKAENLYHNEGEIMDEGFVLLCCS